MKLSQFKQYLNTVSELNIIQSNGKLVPKHFIDCGGTIRTEKKISLQIWIANDTNHRLEPQKLKKIISLSEGLFGGEDLSIEVEFQTETISCYGLDFIENNFVLTNKYTDCLAKDNCKSSPEKSKISLSELQKNKPATSCTPGGGCC